MNGYNSIGRVIKNHENRNLVKVKDKTNGLKIELTSEDDVSRLGEISSLTLESGGHPTRTPDMPCIPRPISLNIGILIVQ